MTANTISSNHWFDNLNWFYRYRSGKTPKQVTERIAPVSHRDEPMNQHEKINYLEFPAKKISMTKTFFEHTSNWTFEGFSPDYTAFSNQGIHGGFFTSQQASTTKSGASLTVFFSDNLLVPQRKVEQAGGQLCRPPSSSLVEAAFISPNPVAMNLQSGRPLPLNKKRDYR
jgi:predicted enzyme related to lactoylglutathione lyase